MNTPTPLTDAAEVYIDGTYYVTADRARELERENAHLREFVQPAPGQTLIRALRSDREELVKVKSENMRLRDALELIADPNPMVSPTELASKWRRYAETALTPAPK